MSKKDLPRFVIYQPNQKEFHLCLQVGDKCFRWMSNYPPTLDVRFSREISKIEDMPLSKIPRQHVYDQGTYMVTKSDTKEAAEKKLQEGIKKKSFAFILEGKKLRGRFSIKKTSGGTIIQKYKDKSAAEEDIFSEDLSRTISTMIPDYDEKKIKLNTSKKQAKKKPEAEEEQVEEVITADKTIGNTSYHFAFYTANDEPDLCLITSTAGQIVMLLKKHNNWSLAPTISKSALKHEKEFIAHTKALSSKP